MNIFMVGATGRTGSWILKAALARGHQVTALVREPIDRLKISRSNLRVIAGDLLRCETLDSQLRGHDAILSALSSSVVADGTRNLVTAAEAAGVKRVIGVAGGGILQLDEKRLRRDRPGYPETFLRSSARHLTAWKALADSSLEWTLFCAPDLLDSAPTGEAKVLESYMPDGGNSVAAGDVAEFIMNELEVNRFLKKRVGITK